nr:helix-turn-helix domain-containing protein [Micromonospora sp. DSM 115978]
MGVANRFGVLLVSLRRAAMLTQEELAERAGLTARSLSDLERGRVTQPRMASVRLLADALGLHGPTRSEFETASRSAPRTFAAPETPGGGVGAMRNGQPVSPLSGIIPRQLPPDIAGFVGRARLLNRLDGLLTRVEADPAAAVISTVTGVAGVGKTALVVRWARRAATRFPDGQLYLDLHGFDDQFPATGTNLALRILLEAFHVPPSWIPTNLDARVGLYRSLLTGRRVLIVLDNARDADQVRPLIPGSPGCLVVVTSRDRLSGLVATQGAHAVTVDPLDDTEAREMLAHRIGDQRVAAAPGATQQIVELCARLPMALAAAAARVVSQPSTDLTAVATELLDHLRMPDP